MTSSSASTCWRLLLLRIFSSLARGAVALPDVSKPPVCIVGAGPAGLTVANNLEAKGYQTVVFDRQPLVGGKCQAYYTKVTADANPSNTYHPLGAAFYSNATWPETVKLINNVSVVPSEEFYLAGSRGRQVFQYNQTTGALNRQPTPTISFQALLELEIPLYIALWRQEFQPIQVVGYKNGVPDDLTVPGVEWFANNNFKALPIVLVDPMALFGYGDIRITPALYVLQYITPDVLTAFMGAHGVYITDFHAVFQNYARGFVKSPIYLATEVTHIDRSGDQPVLTYSGSCQTKKSGRGVDVSRRDDHDEWWTVLHGYIAREQGCLQQCSAVVLAFAPNLDNLNKSGLTLTAAENEVFSAVNVHNYFSAAVEFNLPDNVYYEAASTSAAVPPPDNGDPIAIIRLHNQSSIATSWSWGPYRQFVATSSARDLLKTELSKISQDPFDASLSAKTITDSDVLAFQKWDYFPHLDSAPLKAGFYAKFNALQGANHTYYASSFQGMEIVEWAIRAGQDVAASYF